MFKTFYEDLVIGKKETFGAYKVTKEEIIDFASKYDPQPFHLDEAAAKQSVFGELCSSGWHTCAMTMRMMIDHMTSIGHAGMGSPGVDEIKWRKPVFPGDILSVHSELLEKRESQSRPNIGLIKSLFVVKNQSGETVMTMKGNSMILKRGS